ncbi:MAG: alpha/beta fold hydrolase [Desulfobacterales bacterium]
MFFKLAITAVLLYGIYCGFLFFMQRHVLFPRFMVETPPLQTQKTSDIERNFIETDSGKIEVWYMPPASEAAGNPAPAVIFAHGNGELIDFWPDELRTFTEFGVGVMLVEYPGYGRSEGAPSQRSITDAFVCAYDFLVAKKGVDSSRVVFVGRSIGGGAICALAEKRSPAAIILMSSFTSVRSFSSKYLVPGLLMRDQFDNLKVVASYEGPVLVIHGRNDEIIPFNHGVALSEAARKATMVAYDCGHNDCPPDPVVFWKDIYAFLKNSRIL